MRPSTSAAMISSRSGRVDEFDAAAAHEFTALPEFDADPASTTHSSMRCSTQSVSPAMNANRALRNRLSGDVAVGVGLDVVDRSVDVDDP